QLVFAEEQGCHCVEVLDVVPIVFRDHQLETGAVGIQARFAAPDPGTPAEEIDHFPGCIGGNGLRLQPGHSSPPSDYSPWRPPPIRSEMFYFFERNSEFIRCELRPVAASSEYEILILEPHQSERVECYPNWQAADTRWKELLDRFQR